MKKLFRSSTDSKLSGVCGGLAQYLGFNATLIRLALVVTALFSFGSVLLIYILAAVIIPKEPTFNPFYDERMHHHY
ncbi:phage shock protein PspC (stress-responsive transcriptional regulator) [Paenibacillus phyllosphaerae]|uniref:Phage shock protein PspC (Stress-responsive transcriptional regulator) n=1 Tax=Paenibacillus phyllosphaerae TaxID=274593 RepID=A0A7W5FPI7_9BACL|nr:PspC domain-containing protein [Paenibacillus phyllosphaerae]MBB3112272.1 phage shock protein PspC (stress-responsive transcriptional regulator) [Paenibacillus phyllosphaerae]